MSLLRILLVAAGLVVILLLLFQNKLIYHPRPYSGAPLDPSIVPLPYATSQGRQQAYYLPPRMLPLRRLWVLFPGNGSRALDWLGFLASPPDPRDGFLLIEYPGYGDCEGSPSPAAIEESAESAFATLAQALHAQPSELESRLNLLCLSIGCATGLNFAIHHPVDRIILLAPFTTLRAMARRSVGWPLCLLLIHDYDNPARLSELAARGNPPRVTLFHGEADSTIPISMARKLADAFPRMITFQPIPDAEHNTILSGARSQIIAAMGD